MINSNWQDRGALALPQVTPQKKKKDFWTDNISTGGSIAGSLAGAAGGAAIGSVVPVVGTAIGGLLGAIIGGAGGGALGQVGENAITGDNLGTDVASEALWGGATALPFGAAGKLAKAGGTLVKGLGSDAAKIAAKDLVQEAGVKTIGKGTLAKMGAAGALDNASKSAMERLATNPTLSQNVASKLTGSADNLAVKQFRLTPTQLTNFSKKFGEDAGQTIRKYGFNSAEDIAAKGIDPLQEQFGNLVTSVGKVPTDTLKKNFDSEITKLAKSSVIDNQALAGQLKEQADTIIKKYGTEIDGTELNAIRQEFDKLVNYTNSVANPARYGVNKRVADVLRKTLQGADSTGQLKNVGQEISKLRSLSDIVEKQGNLGRGSLPAGLNLVTGAVLGSSGGLPGQLGMVAGQAALNSKAGRTALMGAADKAVSALGKSAPKETGQSLVGTIARMGGIGAVKNMVGGQSSLENSMMSPNTMSPSMNQPTNANMDTSYTQNTQNANPLGYSSEQLAQAMMIALAKGDNNSASQLKSMYDIAASYEKANSKYSKALSAEAAKQVSNAQAGLQALDTIEQTIANDPSKQTLSAIPGNALNGLVGSVLGTGQYESARQQAIDVIGRLRSGGAITAEEEKRFGSMLPQAFDSSETSAYKINQLRQVFSTLMGSIENSGTTQQDLLSTLLNSGSY